MLQIFSWTCLELSKYQAWTYTICSKNHSSHH